MKLVNSFNVNIRRELTSSNTNIYLTIILTNPEVVWIRCGFCKLHSKDLLEYIQSGSLSSCNSIDILYFSTLYITTPRSKLKGRLNELVQLCFIKIRQTCKEIYYFMKWQILFCTTTTLILSKRYLKLTLPTFTSIDERNVYYVWLTFLWQQIVDISMGINWATLLADIFPSPTKLTAMK